MPSPSCPQCSSEVIYQNRLQWICSECDFEWSEGDVAPISSELKASFEIKDAHGNLLQDGDSVTLIKDLKIKGSSSVVKVGTKVKSVRLIKEAVDGHNLACKVDGFGALNLKSEFVKKA